MDSDGYGIQNSTAKGTNGSVNGGVPARAQPLTLDEALPYSPLSSVVPFNSDIIPLPTVGIRSSVPLFPNDSERILGRQGLESLNREASNPYQTSQRLQQTLYDLKQLLRPEELSHITSPKVNSLAISQPPPPNMSLSPFAQMLYNSTSPEFSYSSTIIANPQSPMKSHKQKSKSKVQILNQQAHRDNSNASFQPSHFTSTSQFVTPPRPSPIQQTPNIEVVIPAPQLVVQSTVQPSVQTPSQQPLKQQSVPTSGLSSLAVVIPEPSTTFRPEDYEVVVDSPDTPTHLSRKRKRSEGYEDFPMGMDQREKADAAFRNLHECLQEIFEIEDQLQTGSIVSNNFLAVTNDGMGLTLAAQTKVESLLQKVISLGRFSQVPLDELLRLQRLSEGALKDTETIDMKLDEAMTESEVEAWLFQLSTAELGLKSGRTLLRLMSGGREEKQLYSEDVIQMALNAFKNIMETCMIPIVELRSSGSSATLFKLLAAEKKAISNLLTVCRRLFSLMANLVANIELSETIINTLEFTASQLIFVENAHSERDSILGVAKFDGLRVVAMDVLAQIFLSRPAQRQGIFDEILTSLEKLPVTKQSARQFKLAEGGSIQLVSALIMRLIQTSASKVDDDKERRRNKTLHAINGDDEEEKTHQGQAVNDAWSINDEKRAVQQHVTAIQELRSAISPLLDTARNNASYVVTFIVGRAMKSTKTGDAPYRNLLDLFIEDFITCLNSTDWPAAELLLRLFLFKMVQLAEGDKTPTPAKNMALDLLGSMGAAISELSSHVRKSAGSLENSDGDLGSYLCHLAEATLEKRASTEDLISWTGPFRAALEFLDERYTSDPQLGSAVSFYMAEWASKILSSYDTLSETDSDDLQIEQEYGRLVYRLRSMIEDKRWLSMEYNFETVSPGHARLAYATTLLHSQFCESFGRVLQILLGSMASEQATVRSKSLKSVNQVLETDPTILDRELAVVQLILRCSNDSSVQVRDSALGLIGKCIGLRPSLEDQMIPSILQRVNDSGIGVRKRAMKLSKDLYKKADENVRSSIADSLLHRVTDQDEGVQELARQTIEEVWMSPFYQSTSSDDNSIQFKLAMADQVALMVKTVQRSTGVSTLLDKILQNMLSENSKNKRANFRVCKALVATMFETMINNTEEKDADNRSARDVLQLLTVFAKADPKLFTADQVKLLKPYVSSLGEGDDLAIYRSAVIIFRHVLPDLSKIHKTFLDEIRRALLPNMARISRAILDDLVACVWIISEVLDDFYNLTKVVLSSLAGIRKMENVDLNNPKQPDLVRKLSKLLLITGTCGKHCDLDSQHKEMRKVFPAMEGNSVSKLMVDSFAPFSLPSQPLEARKAALDAIGMLGVMGGSQGDGVAIGIAQRFLKHITRIALATQDEQAFLATEVLGSINRQGLVHPKETGLPLIALETSQNPKIADLAFREHRALHEKHETIFEKEYMRAVHSAYIYQRDVVKSTHGATVNPFTSKLHMMIEVLKISKVKNRKRFYESLCTRIEFDPAKMELADLPHHLEFSQFIIENMAFFDYSTVDELLSAVTAMEKVVAGTGTGIAHSIETEIFHVSMDQPSQIDENGQSQPVEAKIDPLRMKQLTASSMMLSSLWEARTYLRRQYGLMANRKEKKSVARDLNKAPVKVPFFTADKFWDEISSTMSSLESEEGMMRQCHAFVELLSVDQDFKVAAEGDDTRLGTPSDEEDNATPGPPNSGRGRKRKASGTPGGRKKRGRSSSIPRQRGRVKGPGLGGKRNSVDPDEDGKDWD
ncbi:hypothetical protein B7494_g95 [Chlorociboria aeruginascens]|nr:hypothetical protein B7494_g95 [Chlorociboria aeruginascens]